MGVDRALDTVGGSLGPMDREFFARVSFSSNDGFVLPGVRGDKVGIGAGRRPDWGGLAEQSPLCSWSPFGRGLDHFEWSEAAISPLELATDISMEAVVSVAGACGNPGFYPDEKPVRV